MIRLTLLCPAAMMSDANHLMMALGSGPEDGRSFAAANWQTAKGGRFAAASILTGSDWINRLRKPLQRQIWDQAAPYALNLTGAERARAAVQIITLQDASPEALADDTVIAAVTDGSGREVLAALGVQQVDDAA